MWLRYPAASNVTWFCAPQVFRYINRYSCLNSLIVTILLSLERFLGVSSVSY